MIALDYRCPGCRRKQFEGSAGVVVRMKCGKCKQIITPVAQQDAILHRVYQCTDCKRRQTVDLPKNERAYCIVCGTETLTIVEEVCLEAPSIDQRPQRPAPCEMSDRLI